MLQGGRQLAEPRLPGMQPLAEQAGAAPTHGALRQLAPRLQDLGRCHEREQPAHDAAQRLRLRLQREGRGAGPVRRGRGHVWGGARAERPAGWGLSCLQGRLGGSGESSGLLGRGTCRK